MKTQEVNDAPAEQFRTLLKSCKVPAIRALKRAGMAASTPFRWEKEGQTPKPGQVERLLLAVLELAEAAGTLPVEHQKTLADMRAQRDAAAEATAGQHACPRQILQRIQSDLRELDHAITHNQGVAP